LYFFRQLDDQRRHGGLILWHRELTRLTPSSCLLFLPQHFRLTLSIGSNFKFRKWVPVEATSTFEIHSRILNQSRLTFTSLNFLDLYVESVGVVMLNAYRYLVLGAYADALEFYPRWRDGSPDDSQLCKTPTAAREHRSTPITHHNCCFLSDDFPRWQLGSIYDRQVFAFSQNRR
jgi:hypothetical protein